MKKTLLTIACAAALLLAAAPAYAELTCNKNGIIGGGSGTCVLVSEKLPGVTCADKADTSTASGNTAYYCPVGQGFSGFFTMTRGLMKYGIVIALLFGVLMIVVAGIRLSMSGAAIFGHDEKSKAKEMLLKVVGGIVLLGLIGFILNTVAPWIFAG